MLENFEEELKKYAKFADIRGILLFNVLASFKPEDVDAKIESAKGVLKNLDNPIDIPTLVNEVEKSIRVYDECATACQILTWVTDELKKEQCDCETPKQEEIE